jgi:hypothetical protein
MSCGKVRLHVEGTMMMDEPKTAQRPLYEHVIESFDESHRPDHFCWTLEYDRLKTFITCRLAMDQRLSWTWVYEITGIILARHGKNLEPIKDIPIKSWLLDDEYTLRLDIADFMGNVDIDLVQERLAVRLANHMRVEHADLLIALLKEGQRRLVNYKNGEGYE